jgi:uncharacterized phage protein gp47/JayE
LSGTTSVPKPTFGPTGFIIPAENPDILVGVQADLNAALGGNLNSALESPQGQIASSETAIIGDCNDQFLLLSRAADPAYAEGRFQDGIARIYFIERLPALPTTTFLTCVGLVGADIPTGALITAPDGNLYSCTAGSAFGPDGTVVLPFACTITGPIPCPASNAWTIYRTITGWDSASSANDGIVGANTETRQAFEARRQASVALNGRNTLTAIQGSVLQVPNLLDAYTTTNTTGSPVTLDGVTLPAHSIYVCVAGGDPADVAQAIWIKAPPGPALAGNTTITVLDNNAGYSPPFPSYAVSFQTAVPTQFQILVTLAAAIDVPSNVASLVQGVILSAFAGADGGPRARIGSTVYASRFYAGVAGLGTWARIVEIKISADNSLSASFTASMTGTVMTVSAVASGTIAVSQFINGPGVADGVRIVSLGTGVGSTGTYNISVAQSVGSEAMTATTATQDRITVGIAHVPVLAAGDIVTVVV